MDAQVTPLIIDLDMNVKGVYQQERERVYVLFDCFICTLFAFLSDASFCAHFIADWSGGRVCDCAGGWLFMRGFGFLNPNAPGHHPTEYIITFCEWKWMCTVLFVFFVPAFIHCCTVILVERLKAFFSLETCLTMSLLRATVLINSFTNPFVSVNDGSYICIWILSWFWYSSWYLLR